MSNDPNDRFMISDLSSKLSAYINGEYSDQTSQTRDPAEIGDVFASEIKPEESGRKLPGDELFTDLDQALVSRADGGEETARRQKLADEQRQRAEEARRQQLRNEQQRLREEQQRQLKIQEEQLRQQKLREEQQRQLKIQEEQQRQLRLREEQQRQLKIQEEQRQLRLKREKALARSLAESLYRFDLDQPFTSVRSGHSARYEKLSPPVRSMPSEDALRKALAKTAYSDKAPQTAASFDVHKTAAPFDVPKAAASFDVPKAAASYDAPKTEEYYKAPQTSGSYEVQKAETFFEAPPSETALSSFEESTLASQASGESRYAKSPDPSYRGYEEERKRGSKIPVIIALVIALLAIAAVFILIRKYSSNLTNLLSGTPAASTEETASKAESTTESKVDEESRAAANTDSNAAVESQISVSMAINEEGEIFHSDSQITDADDSEELSPEDPNYVSYLSSVNMKAAEDAIAELPEAAPRLYLTTYGIAIKAGDSFNALAFVERIEDDADDKDRLYRDISVDGLGEFDAKIPGTYELTYFCYDSAGNRSNRAKLTVIVE